MAIDQDIADFLRDAQYRIAEYGIEKNKLHKRRNTERYKEINKKIKSLYQFMDVLYEPTDTIYGDFSGYIADWTDEQILAEIDYLREYTEMAVLPFGQFVAYTTEVVLGSTGSPSNVESSTIGNLAYFKTTQKIAGKPLSKYAGKIEDDITKYFNGDTDSTKIEIPWVVLPAYLETDLSSLNPLLKRGQIVFVLDENGLVQNFKSGPGYWNDLDYLAVGKYPYNETISNQLGDLPSNPVGLNITEIIRKIINPYVAPVLSEAKNNSSGSYANDTTKEIGQSISGTINVQFQVSNPENLSGATPINVTAGGRFSNEGNFANGTVGLTLASALTPTLPTNIEISIVATHTNGVSNTIKTYIRFFPKIIWGVSQQSTITKTDLLNGAGLQDRQTLIADSYKKDFTFNQAGYLFIAIPSMLSPSNLSWADVTDKQFAWGIDMVDMGLQTSVNNGVGTYNYQLFRSKYAITVSKTIISIE